MIVVSDTSPINYLILIEVDWVLPKLYEQVLLPPEVVHELSNPAAPAVVRRWAQKLPSWVQVRSPSRVEPSLRQRGLDEGEIHAIALAIELKAPVLIDERNGYSVAKTYGLGATGTLGILGEAAGRNLIQLKPTLARLTYETSFRYSQHLIDRLLEQDSHRRGSSGST